MNVSALRATACPKEKAGFCLPCLPYLTYLTLPSLSYLPNSAVFTQLETPHPPNPSRVLCDCRTSFGGGVPVPAKEVCISHAWQMGVALIFPLSGYGYLASAFTR